MSKKDIDFDRNQIFVHRQWIDKLGSYGPTKHNKVRYVGFSETSDLRGMLLDSVRNSPHPEAIFVTRTGNRLGGRKLSSYYFQGWVKKLDLPRITFHDLRHTFASWYMIRQDSLWELMGILGHSNMKTTMRYAHLSSKTPRVPSLDGQPELAGSKGTKENENSDTATKSLQRSVLRLV